MKVERSIGAPMRSARQTVDDLAMFVSGVLAARQHPAAGDIAAQFQRLSPLFNLLLAKRIAGTPALVLRADEMEVRVYVRYEVGAKEDLSIPTMSLLDPLGPAALVEIELFTTEAVPPDLGRLVAAVSDAPARLSLRVTEVAGPTAEAEGPDDGVAEAKAPDGEVPGGEVPGGEVPGGEVPGGEVPGGEVTEEAGVDTPELISSGDPDPTRARP